MHLLLSKMDGSGTGKVGDVVIKASEVIYIVPCIKDGVTLAKCVLNYNDLEPRILLVGETPEDISTQWPQGVLLDLNEQCIFGVLGKVLVNKDFVRRVDVYSMPWEHDVGSSLGFMNLSADVCSLLHLGSLQVKESPATVARLFNGG